VRATRDESECVHAAARPDLAADQQRADGCGAEILPARADAARGAARGGAALRHIVVIFQGDPATPGDAMSRQERRKFAKGIAFCSPWLVGFCVLTALPVGLSLYYSLCD